MLMVPADLYVLISVAMPSSLVPDGPLWKDPTNREANTVKKRKYMLSRTPDPTISGFALLSNPLQLSG